MPRSGDRLRRWAPALGLLPLAGLWYGGTLLFGSDIIPWLPDVLSRLAADVQLLSTWTDLLLTLARTAAGFGLAFAVGLPTGLLMGKSRAADAALFLPIVLLQACPPLLWVIPLILILGTDGLAPVAVVFLVVFPLVILNVRESRRAVLPAAFDLFAVYAPSRRLVWRELLLPALTPALRSSLVLGLVLGLKSSLIGEWFGSHTGLGRAIYRFYGVFDMPGFFALVFLFLVVGSLVGLGAQAAADRWLPEKKPVAGRPVTSARPATAPRVGLAGRKPLSPATVEFRGVDFSWGHKLIAKDLTLRLAPGEIVVLTGPSGIGKTTLARLALGLIAPRAGSVQTAVRPAVLFQEDGLLAHRDVLGNVLLPAWEQKRAGAVEEARDLIARVGLAGEDGAFPSELSGGMKKRVALARALMQDPDFLVLDEPFQNLDEPSRQKLWDLVFDVLRSTGRGALIITHYPAELAGRAVTRSLTFPQS